VNLDHDTVSILVRESENRGSEADLPMSQSDLETVVMPEKAPMGQWSQPGSAAELLRLAWPLILSNGFNTLQITIDRVFLSWLDSDAVAAAMPAAMIFWTLFALPQNTASYVTTFVAQYIGAGRPQRVGPVVWQALYFSVALGIAFLALWPLAGPLMALGQHAAHIQKLEVIFFQCLCCAALPSLVTATTSGFLAGRGDTAKVMLLNGVGLVVTALLDYAWIFGNWGFPALGVAGAGWATVGGAAASGLVGLVFLWSAKQREIHHTLAGWRLDSALFQRLMRYGLPSGLQWALDGLAFSLFVMLVGRLGDAELAATSIAVTLNFIAFMPTMGIAQAVAILVGQRLGEDRADLAERSAWAGFRVGWLIMSTLAAIYVLWPQGLLAIFANDTSPEKWAAVAHMVPVLLRFVALYCMFDSMNLVFSFALRGAGDTRFVTAAALALSWPLMVVPTWAAWRFEWGIYWAWTFASIYIIALAFVLLARFRGGRWRTMRVIETVAE
jgi:multidrug resistance protein, MATE family